MDNIKKNLDSALEQIKKIYHLKVNRYYYNQEESEWGIHNIIEIEGVLPNGNFLNVYTYQFSDCNLEDKCSIYKRLEELILPLLETKYEGIITEGELKYNKPGERERFNYYKIGDIDLNEIGKRLLGRKIRIQTID